MTWDEVKAQVDKALKEQLGEGSAKVVDVAYIDITYEGVTEVAVDKWDDGTITLRVT